MNKSQETLNQVRKVYVESEHYDEEDVNLLQELVDKATPKKLKSKTDKDGRLLWVCPTCGDVYMKFWSDVETISCRKHCDECGQALDWSDINDK
jgi:predicted RNA-binding Zn-ribbon protein involved in translation (DUF1610 family)